jgi:hypothetical protein
MKSGQALLAIAIVLVAVASSPSPAVADCTTQLKDPDFVQDVTGTAFTGTFRGSTEDQGTGYDVLEWDVDRVYRGTIGLGEFTYRASRCHAIKGWSQGDRYLVSLASLEFLDSGNSIAWHVRPSGDLTLLGSTDQRARDYEDLWQVDTLEAALALVAPRALPPTDAAAQAASTAPPDSRVALFGLFLGTMVASLVTLSWRRRLKG